MEASSPPGSPAGSAPASRSRKPLVLIVVAVIVVAGLSIGAYVLLSATSTLSSVELTVTGGTTVDQRQEVAITARAIDSRGVDQAGSALFTWSATPVANVVLTPTADDEAVRVTVFRGTNATVSATASWQGASRSAETTLTVRPLHFEVVATRVTSEINDPITLTVRARRADNSIAATYPGTVTFSANVTDAVTLPANTPLTASDNGEKSFPNVALQRLGLVRVTVSDILATTITGAIDLKGVARPTAQFSITSVEPSGADYLVRVDAAASSDVDGTIALHNWTWGDGSFTELASPATSHLYDQAMGGQQVDIVLRVEDNDGLSATRSRPLQITVTPLAPTAAFTITDIDQDYWHVFVDASASSDLNGNLRYYNWTWGDGKYTNGTNPAADHVYKSPGSQVVNLTVEDTTNLKDWAERLATLQPPQSTIDYRFYDFFADPFEEYWDIRQLLYFERPVNAECFSPDQRGPDGVPSTGDEPCAPSNPTVPDFSTYPYTNWYSADPAGDPAGVPYLYARYRFNVSAANVRGYNTSEPVILPVLNYDAAPGNKLDVRWDLHYMNSSLARQRELECATNFVFQNDGYIVESIVRVDLDLQESRRIFGVVANTPAEAQTWWGVNTNPLCRSPTQQATGPAERAVVTWFVDMGGAVNRVGKYDIATGYEWYYQVFTLNMSAAVDPVTGDTTVMIYHTAYGTEVLLGRFFYWGNASYELNHLDSTKRAGWIGQEIAWYEDFLLDARLGATDLDFALDSSLAYHFVNTCDAGSNNLYDRTDDVSVWMWGPYLDDYVPEYGNNHPLSELDRYSSTDTYVSCAPGAPDGVYGQAIPFDVVPITWDSRAGETLTFEFPSGPVRFYDPNLTPPGANPLAGGFVEISAPLVFGSAAPVGYGVWNPTSMTWTIAGPEVTGGPDGSPGNYPLQPWPILSLVPLGSSLAPSSAPRGSGTFGVSATDSPAEPVGMNTLVGEGALAAPLTPSDGIMARPTPFGGLRGASRPQERARTK